jgi:hypothetical protein
MRRNNFLILPLLAATTALSNPNSNPTTPVENHPLTTGDETMRAPVVYPPYDLNLLDGTDEIVGDTTVIGQTWYENQHNGTVGRMLEKDDSGYLHFAWMSGRDPMGADRHIFYNYIDPSGLQGWPGAGYPVESSARAGFTNLDVDFDGIAFPAFHWTNVPGGDNTTAVATDFFPHSGTFIAYETPQVPGVPEVIWPRIQFDLNQYIHLFSTENPASGLPGDPQRHYYTRGTYDPLLFSISYEPWQEAAWTMTIAGDIAASAISNRTAFAWMVCRDEGFPIPGGEYTQYNNDVYLLIDEDGVDPDFGQAVNLTNFIPPDLSYLPDTLTADMDTIRAYTDITTFFDQNDFLHVAFTTPSYFALEGTFYWHASLVWHWTEEYPDDFQLIHNAFDDYTWNFVDCGAWNFKAQRPSLGQDPATGYLYCAYQVFDVDTTAISQGGWPSGEIYVSVSTDGGQNWAVGTNITNTVTPDNAVPGQCLSEITPSLAKVVDGDCHILYILDRDAGNVLQTEGTWTLNEAIYHKVPVDSIPTTPLVPQDVPFHVETGSTGVEPEPGSVASPLAFWLDQNYPNPFNPETSIRFTLDQPGEISLLVYNSRGETVARLASGEHHPGEHVVSFDGSELASGVYIYKLDDGTRTLQRKMLLIK